MFFVSVEEDVKIAVYDLNPCGKRTIVMVHGWPLSEKMYEYQKPLLVKAGYRVITMDLRGFGNSDTTAFGYEYDQLAADIYHVIRFLKLKSFDLVGFSMGGAIVLRYMRLFNGYGVRKLCLLAAAAPSFVKRQNFPYGMTKPEVDKLIALAKTDRPQLNVNFSNMFLYSKHSQAVKDWFVEISNAASGIGTIKTGYSLRDEDGRGDLSAVRVPTGIFHGKRDQIVSYDLGVVQNKNIRGSRLFTFENSGHGVFYDELELFNRRFIDFLNDCK